MTTKRLSVCLLLTLFLSCNSSTKELPVLSYTIDEAGNKNFYNVTYAGFNNQLGESFSTETIQGKICIANFFFTRCPSICPPMRNELIGIAETFSKATDLILISHTIDPKHDSTSVLKTYAEATGIPNKRWQFIRASEEDTKLQAKKYMTNFKPNKDGTDFYHSSYVVLLDKSQSIRGFYNVLVKEDVERLKEDVKQLID